MESKTYEARYIGENGIFLEVKEIDAPDIGMASILAKQRKPNGAAIVTLSHGDEFEQVPVGPKAGADW